MKKKIGIIAAVIIIALGAFYILNKERVFAPDLNSDTSSQDIKGDANTPDTKPVATFDKTKFSTSDAASIWVVVNKKRPLDPKTYAPSDLVAVGGGQQMRKEAAEALTTMIAAAKTAGLTMSPLSGYRSYNTQVSVYNNEVATNGQAVADTQSARPGTSEHQTGLAVDIGGGGCGIEDCFGNTAEGRWLAANAYKYGFIVRYTTGKESVTGYRAEPWHVRYIGTALSTEMNTQKITTLEEFFGLPNAPSY